MIKAKDITHFYGKEKVLDNISLDIAKGEFVCLTGESGSGKSTLLSVLSSLLQPASGRIEVEGKTLHSIKNIDRFRRENIGFVFQFHYLINYLNIKENIELALIEKNETRVLGMMRFLGIEKLADKYPNEISGGQRQRAAVARALANRPKIIFADEPTGNLDSKNSQKVFELFKSLGAEGTTVVIATHDQKLAKLADKVYEVNDGKI